MAQNSDFERELKECFLQEAQEMLDEVEQDFLWLEADPTNVQRIDKIFRVAHTFKGSALTAGFAHLGDLMHHLEALLVHLKAEPKKMNNKSMIDVLLSANDLLKQYVSALSSDHTAVVETEALVEKIKAFLGKDSSGEDSAKKSEVQVSSASSGQFVTAANVSSLKESDPSLSESLKIVDKKFKILICDDEEEMLEILTGVLADSGDYEIVTALDGFKALEIISNENIDLIISDYSMPRLNGADMIQKIRDQGNQTPVIFISALAEFKDLQRFLRLGAYDFFEKPFYPNKVVPVVHNALRIKRIKDLSVQVLGFNFKAYMIASKLVDRLNTVVTEGSEEHMMLANLKKYLDAIGRLSREIVN